MQTRKTTSEKVHILAECAIMVALATVLSWLKIWDSPYGGSITVLSMTPIILLSLRRGIRVGLIGGFVHSLVQLLLGLNNVAYVPTPAGIVLCILLDYILPFTLLGLGGCFRNKNIWLSAILGALLVTVIRYFCHILSGVVIWYELDLMWYADDPTHLVNRYGQWAFSTIYNGIYMIPEIIATTLGTALLAKALNKIK